MCKASGTGTLVYSWERRSSGSSWTTVSNNNTTSYTTNTTLTSGTYVFRCRVSNEGGTVLSDIAIVNFYGEYYPHELYYLSVVQLSNWLFTSFMHISVLL